jgi:hypothetical protein
MVDGRGLRDRMGSYVFCLFNRGREAMTGAASRRRGADAERKVVNWLRDNGYPDARRYLAGDGRQPGDIDAIPGVVIEVKDVAASAWPSWCRQAETQAGPDRLPIVVRRTRGVPDVAQWSARWLLGHGTEWFSGTFGDVIADIRKGKL